MKHQFKNAIIFSVIFFAALFTVFYFLGIPSFIAHLGCKEHYNLGGFSSYECPSWHPEEYLVLIFEASIAVLLVSILNLILGASFKKKLFPTSIFVYFTIFLIANISLAATDVVNHKYVILVSLTFPFLLATIRNLIPNKTTRVFPLKTLVVLNLTALSVVIFKWLVAG